MTEPRTHGHTKSGRPITDADVEAMADEAEAGYDVDELITRRGKRGRPSLGAAPATVESVRLDPELRDELAARAEAEGVSASELIRKALREYLRAG
ncbi:MAG TPA: CopG family transcriptional regulator [Acidimicrobiia bacterium]|jgi:predicted HicB family RNase H-like nuclease|nr:CopG family transcriptional regulator [Acidimicrobiia bacterium]